MTAQHRRRWFSFSLRTLFIAVTIFGTWLGVRVTRAIEQRDAVAAIRAAASDVEVFYDCQIDESGAYISDAQAPGPEWLRQLIGIDYFANVVLIGFPHVISTSHGQTVISIGE